MRSRGMALLAGLLPLVTACRFDPAGLADDGPGDATSGDPSDSGAEPPLGTGRDGELTVSEPTVINVYTSLVEATGAGVTRVSVASTTGFAAGDLVMLHQTTGLPPDRAPSGVQTALALQDELAGAFQLVRLADVVRGELVLAAPTRIAFGTGAQAVRVPELTRLVVEGNGAVNAQPWDGRAGGLVAALVTGTVTIDGSVDASGAGFRGGEPGVPSAGPTSCQLLDGTAAEGGGASKGEGLVLGAPAAGRGNIGHAGGGGNCHNAGGGGGGNGGRGGDGGGTWALDEPYGGLGGAALVFDTAAHLVFGGGGGAGEDNDDGQDGRSGGGAGGGIVLLRARAFAGAGTVIASGLGGDASNADGGGGGGGGGTVALVAVDGIALAGAIARGGAGANAGDGGSGGGGGGGRVAIEAGGPLSTPIAVQGGSGGTEVNLGGPGQPGVTDVR